MAQNRIKILVSVMLFMSFSSCGIDASKEESKDVKLKWQKELEDNVRLENELVVFYFDRQSIINSIFNMETTHIQNKEDRLSNYLSNHLNAIFIDVDSTQTERHLIQMKSASINFITNGDCAVYSKSQKTFVDFLSIEYIQKDDILMSIINIYLPDGRRVFSMTYA